MRNTQVMKSYGYARRLWGVWILCESCIEKWKKGESGSKRTVPIDPDGWSEK